MYNGRVNTDTQFGLEAAFVSIQRQRDELFKNVLVENVTRYSDGSGMLCVVYICNIVLLTVTFVKMAAVLDKVFVDFQPVR